MSIQVPDHLRSYRQLLASTGILGDAVIPVSLQKEGELCPQIKHVSSGRLQPGSMLDQVTVSHRKGRGWLMNKDRKKSGDVDVCQASNERM